MISLSQIETDLTAAMKAKDQTAVDTLRGLKVRLQNEKIAKSGAAGSDLTENEIIPLIKSEIKRRKEAAESFASGDRPEMAKKELAEAAILQKYLPEQMSQDQLAVLIDEVIGKNNFTAADFGKAMGMLKAKTGNSADGSLLAKMLKEKLK
ncbi:MAG: GatB/YqeY domain-containing protein [Candidatus Doudnabacteria bacterium]|nr:GatB/YqeY domain-containing protein [Candidatus Doudnabacteria bacterium]